MTTWRRALPVGSILGCLFLLLGTQPAPAVSRSDRTGGPLVEDVTERAGLAGGATRVDDLIDELLEALADQDAAALHRLRVTQDEYQTIIIPGTVAPGQPDREVSDRPRQYFWEMLDTKSRYFGEVLMQRFGGRRYVSHAVRFSEPPRVYSRYRSLGEVHLRLTGTDETIYELRTGWIAEVGGKYKFLGFEWDD